MAAMSFTLLLCLLLGHHRQYPYTKANIAAEAVNDVVTVGQKVFGASCTQTDVLHRCIPTPSSICMITLPKATTNNK